MSRAEPKVLVLGTGGREHALVHALSLSERRPQLYAHPGNPGIFQLAQPLSPDGDSNESILRSASDKGIELMIVGPEAYLERGVVDASWRAGIPAFGPTQQAARIETSKSWAKGILQSSGVPTAGYAVVRDREGMARALSRLSSSVAVKADGIAAGKGVLVTDDAGEAASFAERWLGVGSAVIVEEALEGREVSLFAFVGGSTVVPLGIARDYKRAYEGDTGPNTGGMGAISPVEELPADFLETASAMVVEPVAQAMVRQGIPFTGVLYAGLMLTADGPRVLEFNARFGDPEAQVLLPRLRTDLLELIEATALGRLQGRTADIGELHACGVTVASGGYPTTTAAPAAVHLPEPGEDSILYHAGTRRSPEGQLEAVGGRVFTAVGTGVSPEEARLRAYTLARQVRFNGAWFRSDIGS